MEKETDRHLQTLRKRKSQKVNKREEEEKERKINTERQKERKKAGQTLQI
jgi:hypothetical protein